MTIHAFKGIYPTISDSAFIHPDATVIGDVHIGDHSSVWPGVVIRGDVHKIRIGNRTNIQDGSILHVSRPTPHAPQGSPLIIGNSVTIAHHVVLHGCTLKDGAMIGMGAIVMDDVVVGRDALIAAGAMVTPGKSVEERTLWLGSPARFKKQLDDQMVQRNRATNENYVVLAQSHAQEL
ncbi:MAG: gamma carbonic anhydrase family protein [Magnetococcales bacterium]|nr:gamma carbonic anhydrase family protein [Magnetococcales bacterium]